jgi:hypothetical protein
VANRIIYDGMFYSDMPSLIRRGLRPVYFLDDGVLNRATAKEADNVNAGRPGAEFAWRRAARDALGIEKGIPQHRDRHPASYDKVASPIVIDIETSELVHRLYSEKVDDPDRRASVAWLCRMVDAARDEARGYGRTLTVGAYEPLLAYANDPAAKAAAVADWKPYTDRLDTANPSCYFAGVDLSGWVGSCDAVIGRCGDILPGKPVIPTVCPHDFGTPGSPLVPLAFWSRAVLLLLAHPKVAGLTLWGGQKFGDPDSRVRLPFSVAEPYVAAVMAAARNATAPRDTVPGANH